MTPLVIAHRGASGHRPEHTLGGYAFAFELGADSIELDLQATRDGHVVCFHDADLARTTDVAGKPEYADRARLVVRRGKPVMVWRPQDFDLAELAELRCRERWPRRRRGSSRYDGQWSVPTLAEVLELVEGRTAQTGRRLQVHAELKNETRDQGPVLSELLHGVSRPYLSWMSFDHALLDAVAGQGPRVRLFARKPSRRDLAEAEQHGFAIGVRRTVALPRDRRGRTQAPGKVIERAHRRDVPVYVWTHRAENRHLPANFRLGERPNVYGDAVGEAAAFYRAGVHAVISDHPDLAAQGRDRALALPATA